MANLTDALRTRLYTTWGTVLYVDAESGELRHGAIPTSPANAVLVADPATQGAPRLGRLAHDSGDSLEPIMCLDGCLLPASKIKAENGSSILELVPLERGLFALKAGDLFLCAELRGRMSLSRQTCSIWECFLASEDWCTDVSEEQLGGVVEGRISSRDIASIVIDPKLRSQSHRSCSGKRLLIFTYTRGSHGRIAYDICKILHQRGYVVDVLPWNIPHSSEEITELQSYYDFFLTSPRGALPLVDSYGISYDKIRVISHSEAELHSLISAKGLDVFDKFASFGLTSYSQLGACTAFGIKRAPLIVPVGINFNEFHAEISETLTTVGRPSSVSLEIQGIDVKRGELVEICAREAGLEFKSAGTHAHEISFYDMPRWYKTVDAVLIPSLVEGGGMPALEAAAAGRLVISTPVGHFPLKAYQGGGIIAPIEREKFRKFTVETLRYYKDNPAAYVDKCHKIQEAARQFDWQYTIDDWVEFIESAK